jgi:hypothetical protein
MLCAVIELGQPAPSPWPARHASTGWNDPAAAAPCWRRRSCAARLSGPETRWYSPMFTDPACGPCPSTWRPALGEDKRGRLRASRIGVPRGV